MIATRDRDRFVVLAQPGYGEVTGGAARGFWRATRLPDARVDRHYSEGSLLAANFNNAWCHALNLAHGGRPPTHFAMIHADVEPEDWWLDTLIDEMDRHGLDVLGVAVPIKDRHGLTSVALARADGDTWRPHCRLTMTDVYRLPETFTSADVGHPILLNTGLWVCRFDESWARKVHFTINDRIVTRPDGSYMAQCEPEDWYFSRLLHEVGKADSPTEGLRRLRIGCTRKVLLNHRGAALFSNDRAWGFPYDSAWTDQSPLTEPPPSGRFVLPAVSGWLRHEEGEALAELARGKRVLEVGSYCGLSTVCMARTAASVVSVDPHDGRGTAAPADTLAALHSNLARYGVSGRVRCLVGTLETTAPVAESLGPFDLVFIDGAHDRESVESDIARARELLAPGGVIALHDYGSPFDPGVAEAADALTAEGAELIVVAGTLATLSFPETCEAAPVQSVAAVGLGS